MGCCIHSEVPSQGSRTKWSLKGSAASAKSREFHSYGTAGSIGSLVRRPGHFPGELPGFRWHRQRGSHSRLPGLPGESPYRPRRGRDPRPQRRGLRGSPQHLLSFLKSEAMLRAYWLSEDGRANLGRFVERSVVVTRRLTRSLFTVSGNSPAAKARAAPKAPLRNAMTARSEVPRCSRVRSAIAPADSVTIASCARIPAMPVKGGSLGADWL